MDDDLFEVVLGARPRHTPGPADAAFIDLTEDPDSPPARAPQRSRHAFGTYTNNHSHNHNARPGRNHAAEGTPPQGNRDSTPVIDLTGDEPSPEPRHTQQHAHNVALEPEELDDIIILRSLRHHHHHVPRVHRRAPPRNRPRLASTFEPTIRSYLGMHLFPSLDQFHAPADLNFQHAAFEPPPPPAAARQEDRGNKMEVAPAREGFSRDTGEDMVVVCPACGGELEYDPGKSSAKKKKNQKEHHFWAVKACGHVYCQQCFENRKTTAKNQSKFRALDGSAVPAPRAGVLCAVDECKAEVTAKTAWVGIYL